MEGWKCMPRSNVPDTLWDTVGCFPVARNPVAVGGSCQVEGGFTSGRDDCVGGAMCMFVDGDGVGECVAMCEGSAQAPTCAVGTACFFGFDGAVTVCLPPCDPLLDECTQGLCMANGDNFLCFPEVGPLGQVGEACLPGGQCPPQSVCVSDANFLCESSTCTCQPLCDLTAPRPASTCDVSQTCTPWFPRGVGPTELAHVGVCDD
jgi:hypothetical protein